MPSTERLETEQLIPSQPVRLRAPQAVSRHEIRQFFVLRHSTASAPAVPPDNWFLKKLDTHLAKHLSNGNLNVGGILRIIGMSRTCLHRKLVELTGMSTTEYIRYVRLRRAAELMEVQPELNMFEVASSVGFNNQSYFTKKFKEVFGCCPRKYQEIKLTARWL